MSARSAGRPGRHGLDGLDLPAFSHRCVNALMARGASREQAEDATQEALLRAWKYRARIRPGSDPTPWVLVIAQRELQRNHGRAHRQHEINSDPQQLPDQAAPEVCVDSLLDVQRALDRLSAEDRLALLLRYELDMTQPEVAVTLGVPEGTAKIRLHRARQRLRGLLHSSVMAGSSSVRPETGA